MPKVDSTKSTKSSKTAKSTTTEKATKVDVDWMIKQLHNASANKVNPADVEFHEADLIEVCHMARDLFLQQPIFLELEAPLTICGDLHGQFGDAIRLLEYAGEPKKVNYLFLGDYVDRGRQSIETIILMMCYKLKYPKSFWLLRGNHECSAINRIYGFFDECTRRYSVKLWKTFQDSFNCMPIAALIDERILCMHGGISPDLKSWDQLKRIDRPTDIPDNGVMCDLLWSDPDDITGYIPNNRGVSYCFGADAVEYFTNQMCLDLIVRAHQVVEDGYEFFANRKLVTLFSAPNYCGEFDNQAAYMTVSKELLCEFKVMSPKNKRVFKPTSTYKPQ